MLEGLREFQPGEDWWPPTYEEQALREAKAPPARRFTAADIQRAIDELGKQNAARAAAIAEGKAWE